jgi:hypothetical protein
MFRKILILVFVLFLVSFVSAERSEPTISELNSRLESYTEDKIRVHVIDSYGEDRDAKISELMDKYGKPDILFIYVRGEGKLIINSKHEADYVNSLPLDKEWVKVSTAFAFEDMINKLGVKEIEINKCTDSDGLDIYVKGITKGNSEHTDFCVNMVGGVYQGEKSSASKGAFEVMLANGEATEFVVDKGTHVIEGVCQDGKVKTVVKECPLGCKDGACISNCKKISGPDLREGVKKVVFVAADFSEGTDLGKMFKEIINDTFYSYEPFKTYGKEGFSFWYVPDILRGNIKYNYGARGTSEHNFLQMDKHIETCGKSDISILWLSKPMTNGPDNLINGVGPLGSNKLLFGINKPKTFIHELGHSYCSLGHSFGGHDYTREPVIATNCQDFPGNINNLIPGNELICNSFPNSKPNCFMGCNTRNIYMRSTFSSIMDYDVVNVLGEYKKAFVPFDKDLLKIWLIEGVNTQVQIKDYAEHLGITYEELQNRILSDMDEMEGMSQSEIFEKIRKKYYAGISWIGVDMEINKMNVVECSVCLDVMNVPNAVQKCNQLPDILGSDTFKCKEHIECIGLYGECSAWCNQDIGTCEIRTGKECLVNYVSESVPEGKVAPQQIGLGKCSETGVCKFERNVDCVNDNKELSIVPTNLNWRCVDGCSEDNTWIFTKGNICEDGLYGLCSEGKCETREGWMCDPGFKPGRDSYRPLWKACARNAKFDFGCAKECSKEYKCVPRDPGKWCPVFDGEEYSVERVCGGLTAAGDYRGKCVKKEETSKWKEE